MQPVQSHTKNFRSIESLISLVNEFMQVNPEVTTDIATLVQLHFMTGELLRRQMMRKRSLCVEIVEKDLDEVISSKRLTIK